MDHGVVRRHKSTHPPHSVSHDVYGFSMYRLMNHERAIVTYRAEEQPCKKQWCRAQAC